MSQKKKLEELENYKHIQSEKESSSRVGRKVKAKKIAVNNVVQKCNHSNLVHFSPFFLTFPKMVLQNIYLMFELL